MSYEPHIFIEYSSLYEKSKFLDAEHLRLNETKLLKKEGARERLRAVIALRNAIRDLQPTVLRGVSFVRIQPELTRHNQTVRALLDECGIEYGVDRN